MLMLASCRLLEGKFSITSSSSSVDAFQLLKKSRNALKVLFESSISNGLKIFTESVRDHIYKMKGFILR